MIAITRAIRRDGDDGKSIVDIKFFMSGQDAVMYQTSDMRCISLESVKVWEPGEYSLENEERRKALEKLTEREKELLGIK